MDDRIDWSGLARHFGGDCTEAEEAAFQAWVGEDPSRRELVERLRMAWEAAADPDPRWDAAAALEVVKERIEAGPQSPPRAPEAPPRLAEPLGFRPSRLRISPVRLRVAAAVAGVALVGSLGLHRVVSGGSGSPDEVQQVSTEKGERARIRLADGTDVVIGPESRLEIPAQFAAAQREVRLTGEAYFDVAADARRPFLVRAGGVVTQVLGTEFNVRAYPGDAPVQVVVAEGRVAVRPEGSSGSGGTNLEQGELAELRREARAEIATRTVDLDRQLGWLRGELAFDDTPLHEVCVELERWYGVPVRIGSAGLASYQLTASFRDQPLEEVLDVIIATLDISYSRRGRTILFLPKQPTLPVGV